MRRIAGRLLLLAVWAVSGGRPVLATDYMMIRATSVLDDDVAKVLFDVGNMKDRFVEANQPVESALRAYCGSFSEAYRVKFEELNKNMFPVPMRAENIRRKMHFPPCPYVVRLRDAMPVSLGDDTETFLLRSLGATPDTKLLICQGGDRIRPAGADAAADPCSPSARQIIAKQIGQADGQIRTMAVKPAALWLPFSSRWTPIGLSTSFATAQERLKAAAAASTTGSDLLAVSKVEPIVQEVSLDPTYNPGEACDPTRPVPEHWPFNVEKVAKAINDGVAFVAANRLGKRRTVVRVADNGVDGLDTPTGFPFEFAGSRSWSGSVSEPETEHPGVRRRLLRI